MHFPHHTAPHVDGTRTVCVHAILSQCNNTASPTPHAHDVVWKFPSISTFQISSRGRVARCVGGEEVVWRFTVPLEIYRTYMEFAVAGRAISATITIQQSPSTLKSRSRMNPGIIIPFHTTQGNDRCPCAVPPRMRNWKNFLGTQCEAQWW